MKLLEVTRLENNDTHNIILVKYSTPSLFGGDIKKERKAFKSKSGIFWRWLDNNESLDNVYSPIDAIMSTGLDTYKI